MFLGFMGLRNHIQYVYCYPIFGEIDNEGNTGWQFKDPDFKDSINGCKTLMEVYELNNPDHNSKATTPVLFDKKEKKVMHNESQLLAKALFDIFGKSGEHPEVDLYPKDLEQEIDEFYSYVYDDLLNGVYKAGFCSKQEVLDEVTTALFKKLDLLEERMSKQRYVLGDRFTFADIMLFPTLLR